jgi:hypothetical protein
MMFFSSVFGLAGNPKNPLWVSPEGLVFVMSNHFMHGGLSVKIIYIKSGLWVQLKEVNGKIET